MVIITAEATYPGYSTAQNDISDLGATTPPNSIIKQSAATIFGVGAIGVALFNGSNDASLVAHTLFALLTFSAGAIAAIVAYFVERSPFRYISVVLGFVALAGLALVILYGDVNPIFSAIGNGGAERWIVYPSVLWVIGFGGYLMGASVTAE
jgi:hypothetical membrane protein